MASVFVIVADNEAEVAALQHALDVWLLGKITICRIWNIFHR